jgi:TrmH family RNA methyltransferase
MLATTAVPNAPTRLTSRQHPVVRAFRDAAEPAGADSPVLLDGPHLIRDALDAGLRIDTLLVGDRFHDRAIPADHDVLTVARDRGAVIHEAAATVIDAASPVHASSGIVALARWSPGPIDRVFAPAPALALGLMDVQDPGNVGAAIRSADALGGTGVIAVGASAHPAGWKALRGAMGSTFRIPVARGSQDDAIAAARRAGARILAAAASGATPVDRVDLTSSTLLLLGSEGAGLPADVLDAADDRISIPMRAGVESLNVAVTAALVLYEARRQRSS